MSTLNHERYKWVPGSEKYYFFINSDFLDDDMKWIKENKIENIKLVPSSDGYRIKSIEPILVLNNLKILDVFLEGIDLSRLCEFRNLENLAIAELNINIDISNLYNLKSLYLLYQKNIKGLNTLFALEELILIKGDALFFTDALFSSWLNLVDVTFLSPKMPPNLLFLKNCKKIKALEIYNSRSHFSILDLIFLKDTLEELKIGNCKQVQGIEEVLPKLAKLKWFALIDSIILKDTNFLKSLINLEVLVVLGTSYFENGDLTNLKGRFRHLGIDDKKHYNLKSKDFKIK